MIPTINNIRKELVELTQEIIKIPSLTGEEAELARVVLMKLKEFGIDNAFIDGIGNVVGVIKGQEKGLNILLNGHLDVVPVGNIHDWQPYDPFGGEIDSQGNIHGRGAADLKGGLAVQLYVMKLLKMLQDRGNSFKGNLIFSAVVHEEAAQMGIPTIGYSGTEERYAHTPAERVNIEMMMQSLEGYFSILSELV